MRSLKLLFLAMVIGMFSVSVACAEELDVPQETSVVEYTIIEPYAYENLQWGDAFTTEQFNLDQNILDQMSTEALMHTALYCPSSGAGAYNEISTWVELYRKECNVFDAFIRRPDAIDVVCQYFSTLDGHKYDNITELPPEYEDMEASRKNYEWWLEKLEYENTRNLLRAAFCEQGREDEVVPFLSRVGSSSSENPISATDIVNCADGTSGLLKFVLTPRGTQVAAIYDKSPELGFYAKSQRRKEVTSRAAEGASIIGDPTTKYNCHSYAWYWPATGNQYWIQTDMDSYPGENQVKKYIDDGSYVRVRSGEQLKTGYIAVYGDFVHSAIIVSVDSDGTVWLNSKWGDGCLVRHKEYTSRYLYSVVYYKPAG